MHRLIEKHPDGIDGFVEPQEITPMAQTKLVGTALPGIEVG